jgi:hypothetical protein
MALCATNHLLWGILLAILSQTCNKMIMISHILDIITPKIVTSTVTREYSSVPNKGLGKKHRPKPHKRKQVSSNISRNKQSTNISFIKSAPITFNIVLDRLCKPIGFKCEPAIKEVISFHDNMIKNHSVVEGTARYNAIRLYAILLLEGRNPDPLDRVAVGKKDRWPSGFNQLRPLFYRVRDHKCSIADRAIRSILYLNRLCEGNSVPDLSEIEKAFSVPSEFRERFQKYVDKHTDKASLELITKPSVRVLSNGPNGKPKWQTADVEAYALLNSELHEPFRKLCSATGNNDLYEYMKHIADGHSRVDRKRLRYITTVSDKGNKCRLVAISDYWTQVLLEPIMRDIQNYTKQRFNKVSYSDSHRTGFDNLKRFIRPGVKSYDVSSWTDAFPATLQLDFMTARYGNLIADAWYSLVVSCKWDLKNSKTPVKYARGQGMGTAGSFDIATVTDLFLLEMVYTEDYQMSISATTYNKVGDDLWCYDPDGIILETYTEMCGISINQSKTKSADIDNICGEFVSRSINYGRDVSRISANICRAVKKNPLDIPQLALHLEERGCKFTIPLREILNSCKVKEEHLRTYVRTFYVLCELYPREGLTLLKKSLKEEFTDLIAEDYLITAIKIGGIERLKDSFNSYQVKRLLDSIIDKQGRIFDAAVEFDSSDILSQRAQPETLWCSFEPLAEMTSKYIMAESFGAFNKLYAYPDFCNVEDVLSALENTDKAMTFKELGVISTSGEAWRPRATKLFNFVKNLVVLDDRDHRQDGNTHADVLSEGSHYFAIPLEYQIDDPIFNGTNRKVIGTIK